MDIYRMDEHDWTPPLVTAKHRHEAIVRLPLTTANVDTDAMDDYRWTHLLSAADTGHEGIFNLSFTTPNVVMNSTDESGRSPLSWTVENTFRLLLAINSADFDWEDEGDQTPLWQAADPRLDTRPASKFVVSTREPYRTAVYAVSAGDHDEVTELLLDGNGKGVAQGSRMRRSQCPRGEHDRAARAVSKLGREKNMQGQHDENNILS
jgi:hypothetical protein